MAETTLHEPLTFRKVNGEVMLEQACWPEVAVFSLWVLAERSLPCVRLSKGHVDIRVSNARGIYRLDKVDDWNGTATGTLVYAEQPS